MGVSLAGKSSCLADAAWSWGTKKHRAGEEGKCLHEAAGNCEVEAQGDILDLVSIEMQQFTCISLELTCTNICANVSGFGCCR